MQLVLHLSNDEMTEILQLYCKAKFNKDIEKIQFSTDLFSEIEVKAQIYFKEEEINV